MGKKLVIVESPAKSKTIGRYLGSDYIISASLGHIRDLPSGNLGVDVKNNFKPLYITMKGKEKVVRDLKLLAADADVGEMLLGVEEVAGEDEVLAAIVPQAAELIDILMIILALQSQMDIDLPLILFLQRQHGLLVVCPLIRRHTAVADIVAGKGPGRMICEAEHVKSAVQRSLHILLIRADGMLAAGGVGVEIMLHTVSL